MAGLNDFHNHPCNAPVGDSFCSRYKCDGNHRASAPSSATSPEDEATAKRIVLALTENFGDDDNGQVDRDQIAERYQVLKRDLGSFARARFVARMEFVSKLLGARPRSDDEETGDDATSVAREVLCRVFDDGADRAIEEWHDWYKPDQWLWYGRALGAFIYRRLLAKRALTPSEREAVTALQSAQAAADRSGAEPRVTISMGTANRLLHAIATPPRSDQVSGMTEGEEETEARLDELLDAAAEFSKATGEALAAPNPITLQRADSLRDKVKALRQRFLTRLSRGSSAITSVRSADFIVETLQMFATDLRDAGKWSDDHEAFLRGALELRASGSSEPVSPTPDYVYVGARRVSGPDPIPTGHGVRRCRDHWHVTHSGVDLMLLGDPFPTCDAALDEANRLERESRSLEEKTNG